MNKYNSERIDNSATQYLSPRQYRKFSRLKKAGAFIYQNPRTSKWEVVFDTQIASSL